MDLIWISQVGLGVIMALMGYFVFKKYPLELSTRTMTTVALLMVIAVLLGSYFKFELPLLGPNSFEIKFDTLPIFYIGILFGPSWGFIGGFMVDMMQLVLAPTGFPFLGFTFNLVLTGVLAGIMFHNKNEIDIKRYTLLTQIMVVGLLIVSVLLIWFIPNFRVNRELIELTLWTKIGVSVGLLLIGLALLYLTYRIDQSTFSIKYMRLVMICEVVIQMVLTSLWLSILFEIPFVLSLIPRIVEGLFMVFILHTLGLMLAKGLFHRQLMRK